MMAVYMDPLGKGSIIKDFIRVSQGFAGLVVEIGYL